jgi:iron complex outermembrane recepter protein
MTESFKAALLCATCLTIVFSGAAQAQTTVEQEKAKSADDASASPKPATKAAAAEGDVEEIVVTGFRASLEQGLTIKKDAVAVVDSIFAEDIGKFPTQNIAEALQRLPGVELIRNDESNEGNRIQLRGLGPEFTLTTFNNAPVRTTSSGNVGSSTRDFNYDVFSSELFSRADVYKTPLAELEEGGVAGVVNLRTPRPFDKTGRRTSYSLQGTYNDQSRVVTPRGHVAFTNTFGDFGVSFGLAKSGNRTLRSGFESTGLFFNEQANIDFNQNGAFDRNYDPTNPLYNQTNPNYNPNLTTGAFAPTVNRTVFRTAGTTTPPPGGSNGLDTFRLDFGNPAANLNGYSIQQLRNALVPRLLRVVATDNKRDRFGANFSLQYKNDWANVSLDGLFASVDDDYQRQILGFAPRGSTRYALRNGVPNTVANSSTALPAWVPLRPTIDDNGLLGGQFGNVSVQNAGVYRRATTDFNNFTLNGDFKLNDDFSLTTQIGQTKSKAKATAHTAILNSFDQLTTIDYNISDPFNATLTSSRDVSDRTLYRQIQLSGSYRDENDTQKNARVVVDYKYDTGGITGNVRVGGSYVESIKEANLNQYGNATTAANIANPLNNVLLPSSLGGLTFGASTQANQIAYFQSILTPLDLKGYGQASGGSAPSNWLHLSRSTLDDLLFADLAARNSPIAFPSFFKSTETIKAAFAQVGFETGEPDNLLRGNFGVRFVDTKTSIDNFAQKTQAGVVTQIPTVTKGGYQNLLPSVSLSYNATEELIFRALYNKTLSRSSISLIARPLNIPNTGSEFIQRGNPDLKPQTANSFDLIAEWYFDRGGVLSAGAFIKKIKDRPIAQSVQVPFSELGLDPSLFTSPINTGSGIDPARLFTVETSVNLEKYEIKGIEVAYQQQFRFLPKPFDGLGAIGSFTYIQTADVPWRSTSGTLYNLSILPKITASGTVSYEKGPLSVRASGTYRGENFSGGTNPSALQQNNGIDTQIWNAPRTYFDASIGYKLYQWLEFRVDAQNITNTRSYQFARQLDGKFGDEKVRVDNAFEPGRTISFGIRGTF